MSALPYLSPDFAAAALAQGFSKISLRTQPAGSIEIWQRPAQGPRVLLSTGIHGDEPAGPLALANLLQSNALPPSFHWTLCPCINPDGCLASTRENAQGLDLNRDFLNRQSPEILAYAEWLAKSPPPDLLLSLHEDCDTSGFYFYEINQGTDAPCRAQTILSAVESVMPIEPNPFIDGHSVRSNGWIFHPPTPDEPSGWPEAIFMAKHGCPLSFTFETPSQAPLVLRVHAHQAAVLAALSLFPH